jgi:CRISPR-associated exonuclease Cas4
MYADDELIPINLLQHYVFCPRQCGLIAIDNLWRDNPLTVGGTLLHERVDTPSSEHTGDIERITALRVHSHTHGLTGKCDVVERIRTSVGVEIIPVEYKAGEPKHDLSDSIQLCAQALCLEEMLQCRIERGAFFYGKIRRRQYIQLDDQLRSRTLETIAAVRTMIAQQAVPPASYAPKCRNCSLIDLCQPKASNFTRAQRYLHELFHPTSDRS